MARYKATLEYLGGDYVGWQRQKNGLAVQQVFEDAIHAFCGERVSVTAAGRTDAGVHALGQVVHFDLERKSVLDEIEGALNAHLRPSPIAVIGVEAVADDFSARFDATARHYLYWILNRRAPAPLQYGRAWHVPVPLDAEAMHEAARKLVGRHDFSTFRNIRCQAKSPVKTLDRLEVERRGDEIAIVAEARSFLHHQVRSMVGSLALVGEGKWSADDLETALKAADRTACGPVAPPEGLYLLRVLY